MMMESVYVAGSKAGHLNMPAGGDRMRSRIGIILLQGLFAFFAAAATAETFTMETSYPSPLGAYDKVDSNQLRLNGYTQDEIDAGALQTDKEKSASTPPAPGRFFYNKTTGFLCYTSPNADPQDKSTWYTRLAADRQNEEVLAKGKGSCVTYSGGYATDYATAKDKLCYGYYYLLFDTPPEIGSVPASYRYLLYNATMPKGSWNAVYRGSCKLSITGLPDYERLYKCPKTSCGTNDYVKLDPSCSLSFDVAYYMYSYLNGWVVYNLPALTVFENKGSIHDYSFTMQASGTAPAGYTSMYVYLYASLAYYAHHNETTYPGDTTKYVFYEYAGQTQYSPGTAGHLGPMTYLSYPYFTQSIDCSNISVSRTVY